MPCKQNFEEHGQELRIRVLGSIILCGTSGASWQALPPLMLELLVYLRAPSSSWPHQLSTEPNHISYLPLNCPLLASKVASTKQLQTLIKNLFFSKQPSILLQFVFFTCRDSQGSNLELLVKL